MGRPPRIRRDELLETARAVFAVKGFEGTTLSDIASEMGVTPAALLRHVSSKQELFRLAMLRRVTAPPEFILALANVDASTNPCIVSCKSHPNRIRSAATSMRSSICGPAAQSLEVNVAKPPSRLARIAIVLVIIVAIAATLLYMRARRAPKELTGSGTLEARTV